MIELIPYERDEEAKEMYLFMRWFIRKHKHLVKKEEVLLLMTYYGDEEMSKMC